ncbi:Glu/Leu/Phe/Val dehydrogenase dimerization domain-containing protein [Actinomadura viridis]|uniref:Glu/Leu/Phe/Val dehydrogenase dimerization domain-containing protein n=1 Tax=Actinomadura viridis TaxID=58110 RepID=UPI0036C1F672
MNAVPFDSRSDAMFRSWTGEEILARHDARSGAWMFVCVHSTRLGPAGGGTRMRSYGTPAAALTEAMDLAEGMTRKMAAADLPVGGGKSVIAVPRVPRGAERERLLTRYVALVEALGGTYITGPDMNTNGDDLEFMRRHSEHVFGSSAGIQDGRSIADATALGTFQGIRTCVEWADRTDSLDGCTVVVQGVGEVGGRLTGMLVEAGADVVVSDVDEARIAPLVARHGVRTVAPDRVLDEPCDVFAPCAMGRVIGAEDVGRLRARIVAGAANTQLRGTGTADALRAAGILYGPDYIVNSGGAMHAFGVEMLGWNSAEVLERIRGIDHTLRRVFTSAEQEDVSTEEAAGRIVAERLGETA